MRSLSRRRTLSSNERMSRELTTRTFETHSAEETIELGRVIAHELADAVVVLLRGDLGAGKTTMVKGIAEAFSAAERDNVSSPTFTLVHEYHGPERSVFHIDLYRLETDRELATLGLEDQMNEPGSLLLVEWGEKFPRMVQAADYEISISREGEHDRRIILSRLR